MPCCCESNVKAAFILGIVFVTLSILGCLQGDLQSIIAGIVGALINGILVFGAHKRNSTAILVWIILAIIQCIVFVIFGILAILLIVAVNTTNGSYNEEFLQIKKAVTIGVIIGAIIAVVIYVATIILYIWAIIVAKNARREIENEVNVIDNVECISMIPTTRPTTYQNK